MEMFTAEIKRFGKQGEKTSWSYIDIPEKVSLALKPGNRRSFRVKGKLDALAISGVALLPVGNGHFILTLNATIRKNLRKGTGEIIQVKLKEDKNELKPPEDLMMCLSDEPEALKFFLSFTKGHQNYFGKWINAAKTDGTRAKRIAQTVNAMLAKKDYGAMITSVQADKEKGRQ